MSSRPGADGLRRLFNPAAMAIVGASDRLTWSKTALANWQAHSGGRPVYLVNPRHAVVHGERAHRSLAEIGEPVDLAFVMVGTEAVTAVVHEAAEAGVSGVVVLSAGFSEAGARGAGLERKLARLAAGRGLVLLGPNAIGFINAAAPVAAAAMPINEPLAAGPVAILLESGGLAGSVLNMAQAARGHAPVSRAAARSAIACIAAAAERLGDALEVIEINPLWVSADRAEVLDALAVWRDPGPGPSRE